MIATSNGAEFLSWDDSWAVGIRELDAQHRHLISLINQLWESMRRGESQKVLADTFDSLVRYTSAHFASEEQLMERSCYSELAYHKQEHKMLAAAVVEFQSRFHAGEIAMTEVVLTFLGGWLRNHILGTDRNYIPCLRSEGVQ